MSVRSRPRLRGFARVLRATEARVAATAFARPCRTRSSCPSAHWPAVAGSPGWRAAAAGLVERGRDHVFDGLGDRGRYPLVAGFRAGVRLASGGRGGDVLRLADGGGEVGDGDDLGHLLDPGAGAVLLAGV